MERSLDVLVVVIDNDAPHTEPEPHGANRIRLVLSNTIEHHPILGKLLGLFEELKLRLLPRHGPQLSMHVGEKLFYCSLTNLIHHLGNRDHIIIIHGRENFLNILLDTVRQEELLYFARQVRQSIFFIFC